jgi:hypothetical protein
MDDVMPFFEKLNDEMAILTALQTTKSDGIRIPNLGRIAVMQAKLQMPSEATQTFSELSNEFKNQSINMREIDRNAIAAFISKIKNCIEINGGAINEH